jgi:hypothetical protein
MAVPTGPNVPHRTARKLAVEKGTTQSGFMAEPLPPTVSGSHQPGFHDKREEMATKMEVAIPAPVDQGRMFTVTGGKR